MTSLGPQLFPAASHAQDSGVIWIPQAEYDSLIRTAHQYSSLCQNLIGGGVTQEIIEILSDDAAPQDPRDLSVQRLQPLPRAAAGEGPASYDFSPSNHNEEAAPRSHFPPRNITATHKPWAEWIESPSDANSISLETCGDVVTEADIGIGRSVDGYPGSDFSRARVDRAAARSVQLLNLPEGTTHADITAVVRGGALLDVFLRRKDGAASVAFVHAQEAQAFYEFSRRNGLYIRDKRVKVKWSDRIYTLSGHLTRKLEAGASRNLVVRRCDPNHTDASVREDLDHIHNLVVVKLIFLDGDCYISTNSVANAMFARTCMMSRQKYKGSRIEWDYDECAIPLDHASTYQRRSANPSPPNRQPAVQAMAMANRFKLLDLDS